MPKTQHEKMSVIANVNYSRDLPESFRPLISNGLWTQITTGKSLAEVWLVEGPDAKRRYLKIDSRPESSLKEEMEKFSWAREHIQVPDVIAYEEHDACEYLLLSEVSGYPASHPTFADRIPELIGLFTKGLQQLHSIDISSCPFDERIKSRTEAARQRMMLGLVDESDFDECRRGRSATDLFEELLSTMPSEDELVFTHGDYCLPNIIVNPELKQINGFIDVGRAGIAARYQDLALASRSLALNFGEGWSDTLFSMYGLTAFDRSKLEFYQLLDEFF